MFRHFNAHIEACAFCPHYAGALLVTVISFKPTQLLHHSATTQLQVGSGGCDTLQPDGTGEVTACI